MKFSQRANRLTGQGMFQIKAQAEKLEQEGKDLVHFEIGDTCFDSPDLVKEECINAIKNNKTHYTNPKGLYELREAIAKQKRVEVENVCICPANFGIFGLLSILCNKGDTIDYPVPGFPTYKAVSDYLGLVRGEDSKIQIINNPNNPTGMIEEFDISNKFLIFDDAYEGMTYGFNIQVVLNTNNSALIGSFSKKYAMPGFRLGYVIASKEIIDKLGLLIETTYSCLPEFIQLAGIKALQYDKYKMVELEKRRNLMYRLLREAGYEVNKPEGGMYCWVKVKDGDKEFKRLLDKGVVVCPGSVFGKKNYIRFCFAKTIDEIKKGIELLK